MAYVTSPPEATAGRGGTRGQLLLVTALSLAILFVTLALVLNTAIYTENLATRSGDIGGGTDAVRYHDAARDGVGGIIDYVNAHNNTSHATLQSNLTTGVDSFQNHTGRLYSAGDRSVEVTHDLTVDGTRVAQSDESRNFTNTSFVADWPVAEDVRHTRAVRFHVFRDVLDLLGGTPFRMVVDDGTSTWRLNVTTDGINDIVIGVEGPTVSDTCRVTASDAWINLTAGTFAGSPCEPLTTYANGLSTPYDIRFQNAGDVRGTYSMIVDNDTLADSPSPHFVADGAGQPFAAHAVYSANVTVIYQTPRLYYESTIRVAPEEADG